MSDFNIFGQDFDGVVGFKLTDTDGTLHTFSEGGGGTIWQDENGQVHFSADGINTVERLTITENGTYTNPSGSYNPVVVKVQGGGGDSKQIKFIDYDGEIVEEYTVEEFEAMEGMPANPSHAGLIAQGWNWDRQDVFDYLDVMPDWPVVIGQMYVTESGKTEIDIELPPDALSPLMVLYKSTTTGQLNIDWGDGTTDDVSTNGYIYMNHNYSNAGKYTIKIDAQQNALFYFSQGSSSGSTYVGFFRVSQSNFYDTKYITTIKAIRIGNGMTMLQHCNKCLNLEYITIPNTITQINYFSHCYNLKGIVFSKNITSVYGFNYQFRLKYISIPPKALNFSITDCLSLNNYTYPSGLSQVPNYSFQNCNSLSLPSNLPSQTKSIGSYAFSSCVKLASIDIPSTVSSIGSQAFQNCFNLASIDIPSTVSSIGTQAFQNCYSLSSIDVSAVSTIYPYTFQWCKSLSSISFSTALTSIGGYTFSYCSNLSSIDIPSTVSSIGANAFYQCPTLRSISIPSLVTIIYPYTFYYCEALSSIDIPSAVSSIGTYAFQNCRNLSSIDLPSALASIGNGTFNNCNSLSSITIPALTTYIGNQAFQYCTSMQEYHFLPTTPPTIGTNVFTSIPSTCKIYVPYSSDHSVLNAYKTKTNWATYSSYMQEEPQ